MAGGRMDGFARIGGCSASRGYRCYSAYSPSQVPDLTALARTFAVSDRTFESDLTASWGSHLELVAGTIDGFLGNNPAYHRGPNVPAAGHGWGCDSQKQAQWVPPGG